MDHHDHTAHRAKVFSISRENGFENRSQAVICCAAIDRGDGRSGPVAPEALTLVQLEVLQVIEQYLDAHGTPPSIRDLCAARGVTSTNGTKENLDRLERKGYLRRDDGARAMQVIIPSSRAVLAPGPRKTGPATVGCASCPHCGKRVA